MNDVEALTRHIAAARLLRLHPALQGYQQLSTVQDLLHASPDLIIKQNICEADIDEEELTRCNAPSSDVLGMCGMPSICAMNTTCV